MNAILSRCAINDHLIAFFLTKWQIFGVSDGVNGLSGDFDMN